MARTLIDLSMPVHNDMIVFPRVVRPALVMYETWQEFAERVGAAKYGATSLTASCMIVLGDHVGTHIDSLRHIRETAGGPEAIPIDYCYGDGVVLDFRHLPLGAGISIDDVKSALDEDQVHPQAARYRADPYGGGEAAGEREIPDRSGGNDR